MEIIKTICEQINAKELNMAKFIIMYNKEYEVIVKKGKKAISIIYNYNTDYYDLELSKYDKNLNAKFKYIDGVSFDQLKEIISDFFNFEYIKLNTSELRGDSQ